jgi:hypothetical protein
MSRRSTQGSPSSSPIEASFFESIASKVKRGRSRGRSLSRSRQGVPRNRSKSPLPPDQLSSAAHTSISLPRPAQRRHFSTTSQDSTRSSDEHAKRPGPSPVRRHTANSDPWRGRHSNSWLFNDFSVTDHAKDLFHFGKSSRN